ncbi:MAG: hypothetical protein AAB048_01290, partial [Planctomycetota bacterium]
MIIHSQGHRLRRIENPPAFGWAVLLRLQAKLQRSNPYRTGVIHRQAGGFADATAGAEFFVDDGSTLYHLYRPYDGAGDDARLA